MTEKKLPRREIPSPKVIQNELLKSGNFSITGQSKLLPVILLPHAIQTILFCFYSKNPQTNKQIDFIRVSFKLSIEEGLVVVIIIIIVLFNFNKFLNLYNPDVATLIEAGCSPV